MANQRQSVVRVGLSNPEPWFGSQRRGAKTFYLDGRRVGIVLPEQTAWISVAVGRHRIRCHHSFFFSAPRVVDVPECDGLTIRAQRAELDSLRDLLGFIGRPWRAITLDIVEAGGGTDHPAPHPEGVPRSAVWMRWFGALELLCFGGAVALGRAGWTGPAVGFLALAMAGSVVATVAAARTRAIRRRPR